jgi:hypothetical protein
MATEIELNAKINTAGTAQGLGELKKSLKELVSLQSQVGAGTDGFKKLQAAINQTEGKIGDLKDGLKTLSGSGVERLTSSLGLLREGFTAADPEKVGVAFKGLGAAMSAIPIFLILEGVKLLAENFKEIIKFFGFGVTESERLTAALEKQKKVNEGLFATQENSIAIMKAEGASMKDILEATEKLNAAKIKAAKDDIELQKLKIREVLLNDSVTESLQRTAASVLRAQGNSRDADKLEAKIQQDKLKRASEFGDQIRTDLIAINKLETDTRLQTIEAEKKQNESLKKVQGDRLKDKTDAAKLEREQSIKDAEELFKQLSLQQDTELALRNKARKDELDAEKVKQEQEFQDGIFMEQFIKDQAEKEIAIAKAVATQKLQIQQQALGVASQLVGLANAIAGQNKGVQRATLIAESAIGIAKIIISTRAANAAANATPQAIATSGLSAIPVIAFNNISAGLGIAASIAATTKALNALGGGGSASAPSLGGSISPSGGGSIAPPQPTQQQQQNTTTFTGNNNNNFNQQPIKTYVVETDLRNSTNTIDKIREQATF